MTQAELMPYGALLLGALAFAGWLTWACRSRQLHQRRVLLLLALLAVVPSLYVGLVWTDLLAERYVRLERPGLALPCSLALLFVAARLTALSPRSHPVRRLMTEMLLAVSALAAALASLGPELGRPLDRLAIIVAIDRSRSIDLVPSAPARIRAELQAAETSMRPDDLIGTVAFAAKAAVEDPPRPRSKLPAPQRVELGRDATDLGAAIRRALGEVPSDAAARIVILSDGVSTRGDAMDAAAAAVAADVPIDVVPLDQRKVNDVRVVGLRLTSRANEGETLDLRIVTHATQESPVQVRIYRNGELIRQGKTKVTEGEDVIVLKEKAPGPGLHRYEVRISALNPEHDEAAEDNTGASFVRVRGPASALILEGEPAKAAALERALRAASFRVTTVGPSAVPADVAEFAAHDVVILSDVNASLLAQSQIAALASYVRDLGGGLLLMGGDQSMGPGGYGKTPIEEVSPLSFDLKQDRQRASLSEVIIIDYSGSMGARAGKHTKLELANEAAARSAQLLGTGDQLGVMHVDTKVEWTVPLGPILDKKAIEKKIRAVKPGGGGIYVDLSLEAAYAELGKAKAAIKHVLLFSDGRDAEKKARADTLISAAMARGISTSVISLGRGRDVPALERMSKLGGGRFYLIEDAGRLPAVFAQETILAARSALNEVTFRPAKSASGPPIRGIDFGAVPALTGYVVTIPKGRSQVLLRGPEDDPILATWSVGIGRSAAFTSDFKDRWGQAWTDWPGGARLFAQLGRDIARRADDPRVRLEADASGGSLHVRATVVDDDGRTESFRRLKVRVGGPDGFQHEIPLEAVGAGAYRAELPLSQPGAYVATAVDEESNEAVGTTGAVLTSGDELRPTGTDRATLGRIAQLTGGKERATLAGIFNDRVAKRFAYRSLTPILVLLTAFALLLSVAARRLSVPAWVSALPKRIKSYSDRRSEARAQRAREQAATGATAQALLDKTRNARVERSREIPHVDVESPPSRPHVARANAPRRPAPIGSGAPTGAGGASRTPAKAQPADSPPHSTRPKKTAAEILLARRRGQGR